MFGKQDGILGCILVGDKLLICILGNSTIAALGKFDKVFKQIISLVGQADTHNLPVGIVGHQYLTNSKGKVVPVILVITNNYNIWLEYHPWEYKTILDQERNDIKVRFQAFPPAKTTAAINQIKVKSLDSEKCHQQQVVPQPSFGSRLNVKADFDFQGAVQKLLSS